MAGEKLPPRVAEALRLLAQGHDAKSIAAATDSTVAAVNERLREARRCLGTTSSREAARMVFGAQENRDEKIDLPVDAAPIQQGRPKLLIGVAALSLALIAVILASGFDRTPSVPSQAKVIRTSPANGTTIAPGSFLLSVTYDRPMMADAMSFVQVSPDTFPKCVFKPSLSTDRRTISVRCNAEPGRAFEVWLNRPPYMNFREENGRSASPYRLRFRSR